jgi:hypothetical protein
MLAIKNLTVATVIFQFLIRNLRIPLRNCENAKNFKIFEIGVNNE